MGNVRPIYGGKFNTSVIGHECDHGHKHSSREEAMNCNPDSFAENERARKADLLKQNRVQVLQHPDFAKAINAAKQLGCDPDDAEDVVVLNGTDKVIAVRDSLKGLGIPKPGTKKAADAAKEKADADKAKADEDAKKAKTT